MSTPLGTLSFEAMTQANAESIAEWHYEPPYDFYDPRSDEEDLAHLLDRSDAATARSPRATSRGDLIASSRTSENGDAIVLGLGCGPTARATAGLACLEQGLRFGRTRYVPGASSQRRRVQRPSDHSLRAGGACTPVRSSRRRTEARSRSSRWSARRERAPPPFGLPPRLPTRENRCVGRKGIKKPRVCRASLVGPAGFEPATRGLESPRFVYENAGSTACSSRTWRKRARTVTLLDPDLVCRDNCLRDLLPAATGRAHVRVPIADRYPGRVRD